jgi:hypothetical protein
MRNALPGIVANAKDPILVRKSTHRTRPVSENLSSRDECMGGMSASNFDGEAPCIKLSASDQNANPLARAPLNGSPTPAAGCQDGQRTVEPPAQQLLARQRRSLPR